MNLLTQLRQSRETFSEQPSALPPTATPPSVPPLADIPTIDPPLEYRLPSEHGGWLVVQFHEGDWGPGGGAGGADEGLGPGMAGPEPPRQPPSPCPTCGCPFWWEDLGRELHCCQCVAIPSRRMAREAWQVVWLNDAAAWRVWEPRYWKPFAHLEAEEQQRRASEAAIGARDAEGF